MVSVIDPWQAGQTICDAWGATVCGPPCFGLGGLGDGRGDQADEQLADAVQRHGVVHVDVSDGALGHSGELGVGLHYRDSPAGFDCHQALCPAAQVPGQDHPHDPVAVHAGGRAEEGVDRGTVTVLLRTPGHPDEVAVQREVVVVRGDIDLPGADPFTMHRDVCGEWPPAREDVRQPRPVLRDRMHDHEQRRGELGWQRRDDFPQRPQPSRGGPDHHDVAVRDERTTVAPSHEPKLGLG